MKKILASPSLYLLLRAVVGGLFILAGALKLADTAAFAMAIDNYGLVSWSTAKLLSRVLPVVEILSGLGVLLDVKGALGLIVAQLLLFVGVVGYAVHLGLDVDCGCFGPIVHDRGKRRPQADPVPRRAVPPGLRAALLPAVRGRVPAPDRTPPLPPLTRAGGLGPLISG